MPELENQTNESSESLAVRGPNQTSRYVNPIALSARFADAVEEVIEALGEVTIVIRRDRLIELMQFLRDEPSLKFNFLSDASGVDLGEFAEPRFAVAYHLYSLPHNHRLRIKVFLEEDDAWVPTVSEIWKSAGWLEREIYDMFGVDFVDHPDLRRILMPADYEGYPLRKDFPVKGY
ncbi:MAG: NADH-quinone oxidoreductase subunit C [Acidobacteria bacterium]|nr:NADH-quinone oxidoreductase subunit C [Acidobacteriota bacterium]